MKQKKITREEIPSMEEKDRMKYEIAEELGLLTRFWRKDGNLCLQRKPGVSVV